MTTTAEIIKIATTDDGTGDVLLWIAAASEELARDHTRQLGLWPRYSRWAGTGHYRSDVYIVAARSTVPRKSSAVLA